MTDEVKFIFRTLIKVPVIIFISFFIFNLFAFTFTYFRLMGISYVAMQTAVDNNFIPPDEKTTLLNYLGSLETGVVTDIKLGCDTDVGNDVSNIGNANTLDSGAYMDVTSADSDNIKVQYGTPITVTISANYVWMSPLVNTRKDGNGIVHADGMEYSDTNNANTKHNIVISYVVPGLKYYPDLS